jgi:hypothetical protein
MGLREATEIAFWLHEWRLAAVCRSSMGWYKKLGYNEVGDSDSAQVNLYAVLNAARHNQSWKR